MAIIAVCDAVGSFPAIFIEDDFDHVSFEHFDLVELHFAAKVGEDFSAVGEEDAVFQIGEDFGHFASGCGLVHTLSSLKS